MSKKLNYKIILATESDVAVIRKLVNSAYQQLADMGLNYTATYQDEIKTQERMQKGRCFLLKNDEKILGTILLYIDNLITGKNTAYIGQFGVWPEYKKQGLGTILMNYCETLAQSEGFDGVQLDTAIPANHLVKWYLKLGYQIVGEIQYEGKTYKSYIFEKLF